MQLKLIALSILFVFIFCIFLVNTSYAFTSTVTITTITTVSTTISEVGVTNSSGYVGTVANTTALIEFPAAVLNTTISNVGVIFYSNPNSVTMTFQLAMYIFIQPFGFPLNSQTAIRLSLGQGSMSSHQGATQFQYSTNTVVTAGESIALALITTQNCNVEISSGSIYGPTYYNLTNTNQWPLSSSLDLNTVNDVTGNWQLNMFYFGSGYIANIITSNTTATHYISSNTNSTTAPQLFFGLVIVFTCTFGCYFTTRKMLAGLTGFVLGLVAITSLAYINSVMFIPEGLILIIILVRGRNIPVISQQ